MEIADRLGIRGVVFHTGLIGGLNTEGYISSTLNALEELFRQLCGKYPHLCVYLENTFEQTPDFFVRLKQRMRDVPNLLLCLDYSHAVISSTHADVWTAAFAPYIGHIHLNDNDLKNDLHLVTGEGSIDFRHFRELTEQHSITQPILLEINTVEKQRKALQYMTAIYEEGDR